METFALSAFLQRDAVSFYIHHILQYNKLCVQKVNSLYNKGVFYSAILTMTITYTKESSTKKQCLLN